MGIYGHACDREYTTDLFNHDLEISYSVAEFAIDNIFFLQSILKEEETGLSTVTSPKQQYEEKEAKEKQEKIDAEKSKLGYRFKEMLVSFLKWLKEIWDKLVEAIKKAIEKMRDLTLKDKALSAMFGKTEYSDLEKAKDNGWKGLGLEATVMCVPANMGDSEIVRLFRRSGKYDDPLVLNKIVDNISTSNSLDEAKDKYNELKEKCNEFNEDYKNRVHTPDEFMNRGSNLFNILKDKPDYRVLFAVMAIKNPNHEGFGWPRKDQFDNCKMLALSGEKYCNQTRKDYYNSNVKHLEDYVNSDINKVLNHKIEVNDLSNESNQIMGYYYKGMLLSDRTQLSFAQKICTEVVRLINFQVKISIRTYLTILTSLKAFNLTHKTKEA